MKTRIISGIVMVPLLIFVYLGGYWLMALCLLIGFLGVREFYDGFRAMGINPSNPIAYVSLFALYFLNGLWPGNSNQNLVLCWIAAVIMVCSVMMFRVKKHTPLDAMATMIGILYIIFFSYHILLVDQTGVYSILKWLVLISAFGSDICAYFTGVFLGKHKMCPDLSPKKTIEGLIGGMVGSMLLSLLFGWFLAPEFIGSCAVIGFFGSAASVCGDLTASAYKRKMGIKDYGTLIPGHGGIMDRFDSVLFTAPFVYYYIAVVLQHFGLIF